MEATAECMIQCGEMHAEIESMRPAADAHCSECGPSARACGRVCMDRCGDDKICHRDCTMECVADEQGCLRSCDGLSERERAAALYRAERAAPRAESFTRYSPPRPTEQNVGFGPDKANNWAGYISVNGSQPTLKRHLWYWFFESRNDPQNDPLVLWMTGGPGCSSLVALFAENGPYIIEKDLSLTINPYSWNTNASVIWIDQPVNTGYSYADPGDWGVFSEAEMAENMYEFLQTFITQYPKYAQVPFYITGESYAGHYVPALGARVLQGNHAGTGPKINLHAIAIGNGLVDPKAQYPEYAPFVKANNVVSESTWQWMQNGIEPCKQAIDTCSYNSTEGLTGCLTAYITCNYAELVPFQFTGLNVYDVREKCKVPPLCYDFSLVDQFLAQPSVQEALGVSGRSWQSCNRIVALELVFAGDWMRDLAPEVAEILAQKVRVVVYSGEYDFICNWYGGFAWTMALDWPGNQAFRQATNTTWTVDGEEAGTARTAMGLTFVRVKDAGHMVPLNQPSRSLDLLARIINGAPFNNQPAGAAQVAEEIEMNNHLHADEAIVEAPHAHPNLEQRVQLW